MGNFRTKPPITYLTFGGVSKFLSTNFRIFKGLSLKIPFIPPVLNLLKTRFLHFFFFGFNVLFIFGTIKYLSIFAA